MNTIRNYQHIIFFHYKLTSSFPLGSPRKQRLYTPGYPLVNYVNYVNQLPD